MPGFRLDILIDPGLNYSRVIYSVPFPMDGSAGRNVIANKPKWERKAEERPGDLLQAALDVFSRHGYRATRLEAVAEEAGVSKGTIYRYFRNKEDLLERALEDRVQLLMK